MRTTWPRNGKNVALRNRAIYASVRTGNTACLASEFGLSPRQIQNIVAKLRKQRGVGL